MSHGEYKSAFSLPTPFLQYSYVLPMPPPLLFCSFVNAVPTVEQAIHPDRCLYIYIDVVLLPCETQSEKLNTCS